MNDQDPRIGSSYENLAIALVMGFPTVCAVIGALIHRYL